MTERKLTCPLFGLSYDPALLLKIILYAYSRGITASRRIEECCRTNVIFMALSADMQPHFTTIADFISSMDKEIISLFRNVLLICDEMGLIGKEMFAIDSCKLPSNASKEWSGTKEEFIKKKEKIERAIEYIVKKHQSEDQDGRLHVKEESASASDKEKEEKQNKSALEESSERIGQRIKNKEPILLKKTQRRSVYEKPFSTGSLGCQSSRQ